MIHDEYDEDEERDQGEGEQDKEYINETPLERRRR